ncbi:hypothetical protein SAMN05192550_1746 [Flavobacterium glycines]|uniref:Uncharacterized protein n=1 Tax=Flavobacterium glycines TaxID=551990 RepID=A0A1B9DH11_9FLAO|nr:hypothetical protein FBGL_15465 [Flavobacterium glycines]GEL11164.1 hypothetical protein FGL01_19030 [Flavobacterium glycines]SDJ26128.1 hypothetical protein SAMN05192550_1746 [Flavobacterium glycines]
MKNFNLRITLFYFFGILFIIYGFQRFFYSFQIKEILYLRKDINDVEWTKRIKILDDFLWYRLYLAFVIASLGIVFVAYMNWKNKNHYINTVIIFLLLLMTFFSGIIFNNTINQYFSYFEKLFGKSYEYGYFACGIVLNFVGSLLILKSIRIEKSTVHNSGFMQ